MSAASFIERQVAQIRLGGRRAILVRKMKRVFQILYKLPIFIIAIPAVVVIRLIKPWILVRLGGLMSFRIGHFGANTELYLCERDAGINVPKQRHVDLLFMINPISNLQLANMWSRLLHVWPTWILAPIARINRLIPGGTLHDIGHNTQQDRDVNNLLDRFPPHLSFTVVEEARGKDGLQAIGIPSGVPFICLNVRDSAYLDRHQPRDWNYHNYRDSNIQDYVLTAETLANRGYCVIRMGAKVHESIASAHPRVIDYATNGMRSDFMDIYLGAKCAFCISTSSGFDAIPTIFRRPIAFVNSVPIGYGSTFSDKYISITKHHFSVQLDRLMSVAEIFSSGGGFCLTTSDYESKGIQLIENTPEEIRDVAIEMAERLDGTWQGHADDKALQQRFWEIFPTDAIDDHGHRLHGKIRSRFGAVFLRNNRAWLLG